MGRPPADRPYASRIPAGIVAVCLLASAGCGATTTAAGPSTAQAAHGAAMVGTASPLGSAPDRTAAVSSSDDPSSDDVPRPALGAEEPRDVAPALLGEVSLGDHPSTLLGVGTGGVVIDDGGGPITAQPLPSDGCALRELGGVEIPGVELDVLPRLTAGPDGGIGAGCSASGVIIPQASDGTWPAFEFDISILDGRADINWAALERLASSGDGRFWFGKDGDAIVERHDGYFDVVRVIPSLPGALEPKLISITAHPDLWRLDTEFDVDLMRAFSQATDDALREVIAAVEEIAVR